MRIFHTATHHEARLLKARLELRKDLSWTSGELYRGSDALLIVSGMGKLKSAATIGALLNQIIHHEGINAREIVVCNFGICGALPEFSIGAAILANRIVDNGSGRSYHSDLIQAHSFLESALETFDRPVFDLSLLRDGTGMVDMETSGVFEAVTHVLGPHQVHCVKVVADHLTKSVLSGDLIDSLLEPHLDELLKYTSGIRQSLKSTNFIFSPEEEELISNLSKKLKLTVTQQHQLRRDSMVFKSCSSQELTCLTPFLKGVTKNKMDSKRMFSEIRNALALS